MATDIHNKDLALRLVLNERLRELGNGLFIDHGALSRADFDQAVAKRP